MRAECKESGRMYMMCLPAKDASRMSQPTTQARSTVPTCNACMIHTYPYVLSFIARGSSPSTRRPSSSPMPPPPPPPLSSPPVLQNCNMECRIWSKRKKSRHHPPPVPLLLAQQALTVEIWPNRAQIFLRTHKYPPPPLTPPDPTHCTQ